MIAKVQLKDGKVKWTNSRCPKEMTRIDGEPIEFEWNVFPGFTSLQILQEIQNNLQKRNIKPEEFTDRIIFMSTTFIGQEKGMMEFAFRIQNKSRNTRRDSRRDTGRSSVLETKRSGMELFLILIHLKMRFYSHSNWWNDSKIQVIQYSRVSLLLSRGILEKKNGRDTIHFNADASNTEFLFQIVHSVNQLSIYAISNWSEQESVTKGVLSSVNSLSRSKKIDIFSKTCILKQFAGKHWRLRITVWDNSIHKGMRRRNFRASGWYEPQNQTWRGRWCWAIDSIMQRLHVFSSEPTIQSFCSNYWRNNYWTSHWSSDRENSWPIWT